MPGNSTIIDVVASVEASLLFTLVFFISGYVVGWLSNLFNFRQRRLITQSLLSAPLAVAVLPILVYHVGHYPKALWTLFAASWAGLANRHVRAFNCGAPEEQVRLESAG